jgi:hypothetical protein
MKMRFMSAFAVAFIMLTSGSRLAAAQDSAPGGAPSGALTPGEVARLLDAYVLVQAQDALKLSDAQYGQFVTKMKGIQEVRRRNQQARQRILQDLRRLSTEEGDAKPDETAIRERLKALVDHDEKALADMRKAYEALDGVLDVRQQARFRVFEETMERRKLELLMRARQANRQRANPRRIPDN